MGHKSGASFSEIAAVLPVYCSGIASVFVDGGNLHVALYQEQILGDGHRDRVIVQRFVLPQAAWKESLDMIEFEIGVTQHGHHLPRKVGHRE